MRDDNSNYREDYRNRWQQRREGRSGHSHIWTGLFILLIGVAALVKASVTDLPDWIFGWQTLLIALGFFIGFKHGFKGPSWLILILIGSAFLLRDFFPDIAIRRYIWPVILMIIGVFLVLKPRRRYAWQCDDTNKKKPITTETGTKTIVDETYDTREDYVDSTSIFSGTKKNIISKNFKGGDIVNIMGGTELDLTRADLSGKAIIELTTIFGGTKLLVPSNWVVKSEAVTIFGGMEDKRAVQTINEGAEKVLILKGTIIFGGIEIKSF